MYKNKNGVIIYRGPSKRDGKPIVVILMGLQSSKNAKTGKMLQTYILRDRMNALTALAKGHDISICGSCPLRGNGKGKSRGCYVNAAQAPLAISRALARGSYDKVSIDRATDLTAGRKVRIGSYGDPAMVPTEIWRALLTNAADHTGYTHQWAESYCDPALKSLLMASVISEEQKASAVADNWRTFRIKRKTDPMVPGEIVCPASAEAGKRLTCETCGACNGGSNTKASVVINSHGGPGQVAALGRLLGAA